MKILLKSFLGASSNHQNLSKNLTFSPKKTLRNLIKHLKIYPNIITKKIPIVQNDIQTLKSNSKIKLKQLYLPNLTKKSFDPVDWCLETSELAILDLNTFMGKLIQGQFKHVKQSKAYYLLVDGHLDILGNFTLNLIMNE